MESHKRRYGPGEEDIIEIQEQTFRSILFDNCFITRRQPSKHSFLEECETFVSPRNLDEVGYSYYLGKIQGFIPFFIAGTSY